MHHLHTTLYVLPQFGANFSGLTLRVVLHASIRERLQYNPISFARAEKHSFIRDSLKFGYDLELQLEGGIGVDLDAFNALFIEGGQMEAGISNSKPFVVTRKEMIDIGGFQYPRYHMLQLPARPMP